MFLPYVLITILHILFLRLSYYCFKFPCFQTPLLDSFPFSSPPTFDRCALKSQTFSPNSVANSLRSAYKLILKNHNGGTARGIEVWVLTVFFCAGWKISPHFPLCDWSGQFAARSSVTSRNQISQVLVVQIQLIKFFKVSKGVETFPFS